MCTGGIKCAERGNDVGFAWIDEDSSGACVGAAESKVEPRANRTMEWMVWVSRKMKTGESFDVPQP